MDDSDVAREYEKGKKPVTELPLPKKASRKDRREDRKMDRAMRDKEPAQNRSRLIMIVSVIGILGVVLCIGYLLFGSGMSYAPTLTLIALIGGLFAFLPLGAVFGWLFGDKYQYVKTLRMITHKDYGLIYMVRKDGRQISHFIKNLSNAVIEWKSEIWHIRRDRIYNDSGEINYKIADKQIKHEVGIPVLFLDSESFTPLDLYQDKMTFSPKDITPPLRSWLVTKELEAIGGIKKQLMLFVMITLIVACVSAGLGWINHTAINDQILPALSNMPASCGGSGGEISGGASVDVNSNTPVGELK